MTAIAYLALMRLKNWIRQLVTKPARLILLLVVIASMIFLISIGGQTQPLDVDEGPPISALYGGVLLVYGLIAVTSIYNGIDKGATFFKMPDVNFLFTAPISSVKVLTYGLFSQLGTAAFAGLFLLYQYNWMHQVFGMNIGGLLLIIMGYVLTLFLSQLAALAMYAYGSGDARKKAKAKLSFFVLIGLCIAVIGILYLTAAGAGPLDKLYAAAESPVLYFIPVIGWIYALAVGLLQGAMLPVIGGLIACALLVWGLVAFISKNGADFYEDVLTATETSFTALLSAKEGRQVEQGRVNKGKTGLTKGFGASVFFHKHMLESRRSGKLFLTNMSILFGIITIAFTFFMRNADEPMVSIISALAFATYMQIFSSFSGRWVKELTAHYVYLIPEPSYKKLFAIMGENTIKVLVEAILVGLPLGLLLGLDALAIIGIVFGRFSIGILLMAGSLLTERIMGGVSIKWLVMMLYFVFVLLLAVPGVVAGIVVGLFIGMPLGLGVGFIVFAICTLLLSALAIFLSRNILDNVEMTQS